MIEINYKLKNSGQTEPKVGVFICRCGGNISDVVDVEKVRESLATFDNVVISEVETFMCSNSGQESIVKSLEEGKINRVVVASCSPRLHQTTFRRAVERGGLNKYQYEHVNIREQDSWAHSHSPKEATDKAISLIRAGVNKVINNEPLNPIRVPVEKQVVVIGGGVAGLNAAKNLAQTGLHVHLIESSPYLGGRMANYDRIFPTEQRADELLLPLIDDVVNNPLITVHLNATVENATGYVGNFTFFVSEIPTRGVIGEITEEEFMHAIEVCPEYIPHELNLNGISPRKAISQPLPGNYPQTVGIDWRHCSHCGKCEETTKLSGHIETQQISAITSEIQAGAFIIATGYDTYEPYKGEYGWLESSNIITTPQLIRMLAPGGLFEKELILNRKKIKNIVFIHCVGSRQIEGINKPGKNGKVNEYCSRVCCTTALGLANQIKEKYPETNIYDLYQDIRTYGRFHEQQYYEKASKNGVIFLKYLPEQLPEVTVLEDNKNGSPIKVNIKDQLTFGEEIQIPADLLVLVVGMVPRDQTYLIEEFKLPVGNDSFLLEVHPKLRPVEIATAGILLAGTAQSPMDITESSASAAASASKAATILSGDYTELEPFIAVVNQDLCDGCELCLQECEYSNAIRMVNREINGKAIKQAEINPVLCKGCGSCVAVCPQAAIDVKGYSIKSLRDMVDAFVMEV